MYTGSVGSGKSYHAIKIAYDWLKCGKKVIANFPMNFQGLKLKPQKILELENRFKYVNEITTDYLLEFAIANDLLEQKKESQVLVLIDEAGIQFNSRDWNVGPNIRKAWIQFLSQSRKFGYDFIFVVQSDRMMDRQIRGLIEFECKHLKLNYSPYFKWLNLFKITLFMYNYKWIRVQGLKGQMQLDIYRSKLGDMYDTMKLFDLDLTKFMTKKTEDT